MIDKKSELNITSGQMQRHMHTHTGEKPFKCEVCGLCFARCNCLKIEAYAHSQVGTSLDWRLSLCWENSRKRSTTTFHQRDKYFFCIYCIHKLFKLTFAYILYVFSNFRFVGFELRGFESEWAKKGYVYTVCIHSTLTLSTSRF